MEREGIFIQLYMADFHQPWNYSGTLMEMQAKIFTSRDEGAEGWSMASPGSHHWQLQSQALGLAQ